MTDELNPYASPTTDLITARPVAEMTEDERIRKEYLSHEASVRSIGVLYYLGAIFCGLIVVGTLPGVLNRGAGPVLLAIVMFGLPAVLLGTIAYGLRRLRPWARVPTTLLSIVGLMGLGLGTLISAYILYLVLSRKGKVVFSDEYRELIRRTPHVRYKTSPVVWFLLGLVLLVLLLAIVAPLLSSMR